MTSDFNNAADYYDQAYKMKLIYSDYSLFQKALATGVQKKYTPEIADLNTFINTYSTSTYLPKAKFELALAYDKNNQSDLALAGFKKFADDYPNNENMNVCLSKIGLIYFAKKDDENALVYFDKLVRRDRKSSEAIAAINEVKMIYMAKSDPDGLDNWIKSVGGSIPQGELDSLTFNNGANHYLDGDCKSVISDFEKYIQKFPDGIFSLKANYFKAECDYKLGNADAALTGYAFVISKNKNEFTEQSLLRASGIEFKKQNYPKAIEYYKQLETLAEDPKSKNIALTGLMRSYYNLKDQENTMAYSDLVLKIENVSEDLKNEAHFDRAQLFLTMQKNDDALAEFQSVVNSAKNELAAESAYNIANILFLKNDYKQSKKVVFDLISGDGDYPYWVTKAMILLADDYVGLKDNFQAKATLKGVIGDSDIPEFIKIAQEKLDKIIADEEAAKQVKAPVEPLKVEFQNNTPEQNKLFTEPVVPPTPIEGEPKHD
jgi:TolA-binding protein